MKRTFILATLLTTIAANAQTYETSISTTPQTIESIASTAYEPEWYKGQAKAWQQVVDKDAKDQTAWRNLFRATHFYEMLSNSFGEDQDNSATAEVLRKMEQAVPDSYVLNMCKERFSLSGDSLAETHQTLSRAIELMPEDALGDDITLLACREWLYYANDDKVHDLLVKAYQKQSIPESIMHYNWNMMQSMEPNAIYFGNGDNCLVPGKMMQEALGVRKDVTIIPASYLYAEEFRDALYKQLGIKPFVQAKDYDRSIDGWEKEYSYDIIMHIIKESHRPAYFFTDITNWTSMPQDSLYNEGLLLKYSDHQYDNFAVAMHNVKNVYHLEYLTEPDLVYTSWDSCKRFNNNYVFLLAHLIKQFRQKGDIAEAERLHNTLSTYIGSCEHETRDTLSQEMKRQAGLEQ